MPVAHSCGLQVHESVLCSVQTISRSARVGVFADVQGHGRGSDRMLKIVTFTAMLLLTAPTVGFAQMPCERLNSVSLPNATITSAQAIPAGPYLPNGLPADAAQYAKVQLP